MTKKTSSVALVPLFNAVRANGRFAMGLVIAVGVSGCTRRIADFTGISTKNIYAKGVDVSKLPKREGVTGRDARFLGSGANLKDALDKALVAGRGNLMIDCAVYTWEAPFVSGYEVRGTVVDVPYRSEVTKPAAESSGTAAAQAAGD